MFQATSGGLVWGAVFTAFLVAASVTDVRTRRIPNPLVLSLLAVGIAFSIASRPVPEALLASAGGVGLGFAIWIGFWLVGVMGAGDVKFFAAIGAWLGPAATWRAALAAAIVGGLLAVLMLLHAKGLGPAMRRLSLALSSGSLAILGHAQPGEATPQRHLPYGVALAVGALMIFWFPGLLP